MRNKTRGQRELASMLAMMGVMLACGARMRDDTTPAGGGTAGLAEEGSAGALGPSADSAAPSTDSAAPGTARGSVKPAVGGSPTMSIDAQGGSLIEGAGGGGAGDRGIDPADLGIEEEPVVALIIFDRSGSMAYGWSQPDGTESSGVTS